MGISLQSSSSAGKRKADHVEDDSQATSKRAKEDEDAPSQASEEAAVQPTNATIPVIINLPPKTPNTVKIASWNVAGLRAAVKKGFKFYVEAEEPDILILTENKVNEQPTDAVLKDVLESRYKHRYWSIATQKGYAGTAVFSKYEPLSVAYTLPDFPNPEVVKGRLVILEFETCWIVGTYVPNAGAKLKSMDAKDQWQTGFEAHIRDLDSRKPVIWAGDLNVAPTPRDLFHPKTNWNKTAGYTEIECSWFAKFLRGPGSETTTTTTSADADAAVAAPSSGKFIDVWRKMNPKLKHFTYFSMMRKCREKGIGWRLDMFVLSERLYSRVKTCEIRSEIYGASDHVPIVLELEGDL